MLLHYQLKKLQESKLAEQVKVVESPKKETVKSVPKKKTNPKK